MQRRPAAEHHKKPSKNQSKCVTKRTLKGREARTGADPSNVVVGVIVLLEVGRRQLLVLAQVQLLELVLERLDHLLVVRADLLLLLLLLLTTSCNRQRQQDKN